MKFAFISTMDGSPWGGSEELWSQAATRLNTAGHDVRASVEYWPQFADQVTALAEHGIKIEIHSSRRVQPARTIWGRFSRNNHDDYSWLKRFKPDLVVISQGHNAGGFAWAKACRDAGLAYVMIVHCNSEFWWFQDRLGAAVASYSGARSVFCVSRRNVDQLRLQLAEPLPNAEVVRSPYNVSPECSLTWPEGSATWRLACVARLDVAAKGQELLLQTLAQSEWRARPIELNLFGIGPDEEALRRTAQMLKLNNVHFRGHVSDISAIWQQNHLLVLPSRYEGLPLTLIEAMWCARPSVVTDVGGSAELCVDNETGFVAGAATVASFADALQRAWDRRQDWRHIGQLARARVETLIPKDPVEVFCVKLNSCAQQVLSA